MKFKLALLATVAGLSVFSASQSSAHNQGWYVGLEAGGNWIGDNDVAFQSAVGDNYVGTVSFDTGWAGLATIGYGFERNWRVEFEAGYRDNDTDTFFLGKNANQIDLTRSGNLTEWSFMANAIYDVPLASKLDLNVGIGVGADLAKFKDGATVDDQDWNFAYQAIVGLSYAVSDRLDLTLTYRYLNVDAPSFADATARGVNTYTFDDVEKHTVTVGLRYDLYADETPLPPEPLVAPPTATPEPEQFVIFFGFNKCNITPEADSVLGEAASAAKSNGSASVVIVGHTDTVGSDEYNQKLSQCRANAAKSNLVSKGIADGSISTMGRGETELLVKTGDNVKEPQNRRATIDLNK